MTNLNTTNTKATVAHPRRSLKTSRRSSLRTSRRSSIVQREEADINYITSHLNDDELETAARTSYAYLQSSSEEGREFYAAAMARRYLRSKKDRSKALEKVRATCQFRKDINVDALRRAFNKDGDHETQQHLRHGLASKYVYVQGLDKDGRSTYIFEPRLVQGHDAEWTIKQHVYTLERAIACSQYKGQVNAVVNFAGFRAIQHAPPHQIGVDFLTTLRSHYAGHVHTIFLVDAPLAFVALWAVFKQFVGRGTRDKIVFVSSQHQKIRHIGALYEDDQAPSWMLPTGTKNRPLDMDEYLQQPFDTAFDQ